MQFDENSRGFSFQNDGPLDMRMDPTSGISAKDVVNELSEKQLGEIFRELGEEPLWRKGAKAIIEERTKKPIETTGELSKVIESKIHRLGKIHPGTKIFQAIRIYVNKELESIERSLKKAIELMSVGGKTGVLSFHSLEDRIVKTVFREASRPLRNLRGQVVSEALVTNLTKKPIVPSFKERKVNNRSRSAKLRFVCKK